MKEKFNVEFLPEAVEFMNGLEEKARTKIYYNLKKAQLINDQELFKKLNENIWELRTLYKGNSYRLFAFWDNTNAAQTLVLATHGILKKTNKTPSKEIEKALNIRLNYFKQKK